MTLYTQLCWQASGPQEQRVISAYRQSSEKTTRELETAKKQREAYITQGILDMPALQGTSQESIDALLSDLTTCGVMKRIETAAQENPTYKIVSDTITKLEKKMEYLTQATERIEKVWRPTDAQMGAVARTYGTIRAPVDIYAERIITKDRFEQVIAGKGAIPDILASPGNVHILGGIHPNEWKNMVAVLSAEHQSTPYENQIN